MFGFLFSLCKKVHDQTNQTTGFKSSRQEVFSKKGVLKNFSKFAGRRLCQSLFLNKVADLRSEHYSKKTLSQVFSREILRVSFFIEHLWLLLLKLDNPFRFSQQKINHMIYAICRNGAAFLSLVFTGIMENIQT